MTDGILAATLFGHRYEFRDIKDLLAKANEEKSGDRLAGIAASLPPSGWRPSSSSPKSPRDAAGQPAVPYDEDEVTGSSTTP